MSEDADAIFRKWVTVHGDVIARIANVHALAPADRSDLQQQILIELWRSVRRFDGRCAPATWIYRVALNTALTFRRTESRRRKHFVPVEKEHIEALAAPPVPKPAIDRLYKAIHKLEPVERSLVLLSLDSTPYEQIAEVTGLSVTNVGVRLSRARRKLAALIEDSDNDA
jgi:RNA polymerase sigma-70 factor (ECF subfamily)